MKQILKTTGIAVVVYFMIAFSSSVYGSITDIRGCGTVRDKSDQLRAANYTRFITERFQSGAVYRIWVKDGLYLEQINRGSRSCVLRSNGRLW